MPSEPARERDPAALGRVRRRRSPAAEPSTRPPDRRSGRRSPPLAPTRSHAAGADLFLLRPPAAQDAQARRRPGVYICETCVTAADSVIASGRSKQTAIGTVK